MTKQYQFNTEASYLGWAIDPSDHDLERWVAWILLPYWEVPDENRLWLKKMTKTIEEMGLMFHLIDDNSSFRDGDYDFYHLDLKKIKIISITDNTLTIEYDEEKGSTKD